MGYKVIPTETFKQQVRELQKSYPHIRSDLRNLHEMLQENPKSGKALGKKLYKIRLKNSDSQKGKRGGYRVISYVIDDDQKVRLLTIYAKSQKVNIRDDEIVVILQREGLL